MPEFFKMGQSHLLFIHFSINSSAIKLSCRSPSCKIICSPSCHMTNKIKLKINRFLYLDMSFLNLINRLLHFIRKLSEQFDCKDIFSLLLSLKGGGTLKFEKRAVSFYSELILKQCSKENCTISVCLGIVGLTDWMDWCFLITWLFRFDDWTM